MDILHQADDSITQYFLENSDWNKIGNLYFIDSTIFYKRENTDNARIDYRIITNKNEVQRELGSIRIFENQGEVMIRAITADFTVTHLLQEFTINIQFPSGKLIRLPDNSYDIVFNTNYGDEKISAIEENIAVINEANIFSEQVKFDTIIFLEKLRATLILNCPLLIASGPDTVFDLTSRDAQPQYCLFGKSTAGMDQIPEGDWNLNNNTHSRSAAGLDPMQSEILNNMSEKHKRVIELRKEGKIAKEIAGQAGYSTGYVHRLFGKFRKLGLIS